jgi:hypothetical protein
MRGRDNLEDIGVDRSIILEFIIKTLNGKGYGPDWCVSGLGYEAGSCECGDTHSGSIKCGESLGWLRNC